MNTQQTTHVAQGGYLRCWLLGSYVPRTLVQTFKMFMRALRGIGADKQSIVFFKNDFRSGSRRVAH